MAEIAKKMCRSLDTIKFYKRNIFDKLGVTNITEAISRAALNKLFWELVFTYNKNEEKRIDGKSILWLLFANIKMVSLYGSSIINIF